MRRTLRRPIRYAASRRLNLARVLLVHSDLAPRLALQTILEAGGYAVSVASTLAQALTKLDTCEYELVLCEGPLGAPETGRHVLAYARLKDYAPATALITSDLPVVALPKDRGRRHMAIRTENLPALLEKIAELIGVRASRRYGALRVAS